MKKIKRLISQKQGNYKEELVQRGILLPHKTLPLKSQKTAATHPKMSYPQLARMSVIGESARTCSELTRQSFGMSHSEYIGSWKRRRPLGRVGEVLDRLKQILSSEERSEAEMRQISETLGYSDVLTMLAAFGIEKGCTDS